MSAYDNRQVRLANLDFWQVEMGSGPRIQLGRLGFPAASVRPYVIGSYADLFHRPFLRSAGEGVSASSAIGKRSNLDLSFERRWLRFFDSDRYPTLDERDSRQDAAQAALRTSLTPRLTLGMGLTHVREDARTSFWSHEDFGGWGVLTYYFRPAFAPGPRDWSLSADLLRRRAAYAGPDPSVDPLDTRVDREWLTGLTGSMPIGASLSSTVRLQWRDLNSTVPLYGVRDLSFLVGVTWTASGRSSSHL
jgi:hypothetical protein